MSNYSIVFFVVCSILVKIKFRCFCQFFVSCFLFCARHAEGCAAASGGWYSEQPGFHYVVFVEYICIYIIYDFTRVVLVWSTRRATIGTAGSPAAISLCFHEVCYVLGIHVVELFFIFFIWFRFYFRSLSRARRRATAGSPAWDPSRGWSRGCTSTSAMTRSRGCWRR